MGQEEENEESKKKLKEKQTELKNIWSSTFYTEECIWQSVFNSLQTNGVALQKLPVSSVFIWYL